MRFKKQYDWSTRLRLRNSYFLQVNKCRKVLGLSTYQHKVMYSKTLEMLEEEFIELLLKISSTEILYKKEDKLEDEIKLSNNKVIKRGDFYIPIHNGRELGKFLSKPGAYSCRTRYLKNLWRI